MWEVITTILQRNQTKPKCYKFPWFNYYVSIFCFVLQLSYWIDHTGKWNKPSKSYNSLSFACQIIQFHSKRGNNTLENCKRTEMKLNITQALHTRESLPKTAMCWCFSIRYTKWSWHSWSLCAASHVGMERETGNKRLLSSGDKK